MLTALSAAEVSASEVLSSARLVEDPHVLARQSVIEVDDPILGRTLMQNIVPRLSANPGRIEHAGPVLGSANDSVYGELLGLSAQQQDDLRAAGVI